MTNAYVGGHIDRGLYERLRASTEPGGNLRNLGIKTNAAAVERGLRLCLEWAEREAVEQHEADTAEA